MRLGAAACVLITFALVPACGGETPPPSTPAQAPAAASTSAMTEAGPPPAPPPAAPVASASPDPSASEEPAPHPSAALFLALRAREPARPAVVAAVATKDTGCKMHGALPDSSCTPGATMNIDLDVICHQPTSVRRQVKLSDHKLAFTEYGYTLPQAKGAFEVDHLIPLELGGDNTIENLWAEPANPKPGFHEKDHVEDYLHKQVCSGAMTLDEAQRVIVSDWLSVWKKISGSGDDGEED